MFALAVAWVQELEQVDLATLAEVRVLPDQENESSGH
jgi:hypothetical protein